MKARTPSLIGLLIALGVMFTAFESQARPPLQHAARGVIQSIDQTNHTLVLAESTTATNRVFVWKNYTRFRVGWHKASPEMLHTGQAIKLSYRREVGQLVLYEVRWSKANRKEK